MALKTLRQVSSVGFVLLLAGCTLPFGTSSTSNNTPAKLSQPDLVAKVTKSTVRLVGAIKNGTASGTGVIVDSSKGLVLTNSHVVSGLASLKVQLPDGTETPGQVVAKAPCDDLAVVKIVNPPSGIQAINIGDSAALRAGEHVTALGFPSSFQSGTQPKPSATEGSVSVSEIAAEPDPSLPKYGSLIQHQAPINPGNSGGPLVNDAGDLVGINTLGNTITPGGRTIQGQSYSITSKKVKVDLPDLENGKSSGDIGWAIYPSDDVASFVQSNGGTISSLDNQKGMYVDGVETGSPADSAVSPGAVVIQMEGTQVTTVQKVCDILLSKAPGASVSVSGYDAFSSASPIPIETATIKLR